MSLTELEVEQIAGYLLQAEADRMAVPGLEATHAKLSLADGYRVQRALIRQKLAAGDRPVGWKLGLTSKEKQAAMGVFEPVYGALFASTMLGQPEVPFRQLIHPRIEPEIAVILGEDLAGPDVTPARALGAVQWVLPALEVIDSRYQDFKFTLPDVVADNASTALAYAGPQRVAPDGLDLATLGVVFSKNGQVIATATGAAVLGDPAVALALLANQLAAEGLGLKAGDLVFTGALTAATKVEPGDLIEAKFATLGAIRLRVAEGK